MPCQGASNEYQQYMFLQRNKKNKDFFFIEKKVLYLELRLLFAEACLSEYLG